MAVTTPKHHPDQFLLADYVAGNVAPAVALPMAVHLEYCPHCRSDNQQLMNMASCLFESLDPVPVGDDSLDRLLQAIDAKPATPLMHRAARSAAGLPRALTPLLDGDLSKLEWTRQGSTLKVARLPFGDPEREVSLHQLKAGSWTPEHGHRGTEITVVLRGGFSDADGDYQAGDFVVRTAGEVHRPAAWPHSDCLTLSVLDGPIYFQGVLARLANPFLKLRPR